MLLALEKHMLFFCIIENQNQLILQPPYLWLENVQQLTITELVGVMGWNWKYHGYVIAERKRIREGTCTPQKPSSNACSQRQVKVQILLFTTDFVELNWVLLQLQFPPFLTIGSRPLAKKPMCSGVLNVYSDVFVGSKYLYHCKDFCKAGQSLKDCAELFQYLLCKLCVMELKPHPLCTYQSWQVLHPLFAHCQC